MYTAEQIEAMMQAAFPGGTVAVRDTAGDNNHFEALVVSASFEGMPLVKRHQAVFAALGGAMVNDKIHALQIKALTPAQWNTK